MSTQPGGGMSMELVQETAVERGESDDMIFTREEFARFDHHFKRRLAGEADTDEISGRSTMLEIQAYFVRQRSLGEYAED
jgi:hypothetical protein